MDVSPQILSEIAKASGTTGVSSLKQASNSTSLFGSSTLQNNYEMFLKLLTTQLKNQNPLEPMDADKFTQQLVQYSQIEQQINGNKSLTELTNQNKSSATIGALGFLNTEITASGNSALLKDANASWTLQSPSQSTLSAKITIRNALGQIVKTDTKTLSPGSQTYSWNGRDAKGDALPDGEYTIGIEATDATNAIIPIRTLVKGTVTGIDMSAGEPVLIVGTKRVLVSEITSVAVPNATTH